MKMDVCRCTCRQLGFTSASKSHAKKVLCPFSAMSLQLRQMQASCLYNLVVLVKYLVAKMLDHPAHDSSKNAVVVQNMLWEAREVYSSIHSY